MSKEVCLQAWKLVTHLRGEDQLLQVLWPPNEHVACAPHPKYIIHEIGVKKKNEIWIHKDNRAEHTLRRDYKVTERTEGEGDICQCLISNFGLLPQQPWQADTITILEHVPMFHLKTG